MASLRTLAAVAVAAVAAGAGAGRSSAAPSPATFAPAVSSATGAGPSSVAVADLDGDGAPDLVVADRSYPGDLSVLLGNGDGSFAPRTDIFVGGAPASVAVGDLNGDGKPDLAVANGAVGQASVSVLLGNGGGSFGAKTDYATGGNPSSVAIADLNGDGHPDLVTADDVLGTGAAGAVSVLAGNGDGTFATHSDFTVGNQPLSLAIGDLNGDGIPDVAAANNGDGTVSVLLGTGGGLGAKTDYPTGAGAESAAVGDLNGDGIPDIAVANFPSGTVSVLLGKGDGTFAAAANYPAATSDAAAVAIGDLNGDGIPDLAVADYGAAAISVLLGNGDGSFGSATEFTAAGAGDLTTNVAIADVNGDGRNDLVGVNTRSNTVSVLLNTTGSPSAGVTAQVLPSLTVSLDKTSLDFGSLLPGASSSRSLTATVTSNDGAGYQLGISRTAFTPAELPLTIACATCGLAATPVPVGSIQTIAATSTTSATGGDIYATTLALGPIPIPAPAGNYTSTLTFTVVGL